MRPEEAKTPDRNTADPAPKDNCPSWAHSLIIKILELETKHGHLAPADKEWQISKVEELFGRTDEHDLDSNSATIDASAVDRLFQKVCQGLTGEGFEPDQIAKLINKRITGDAKLAYCNAEEVSEALTNGD